MNRIKRFTAIMGFALLVLGLPAIASAQWRDDRNRDDDRYGRNGGYNNGRYGDMRSTVRSLKQRTREFQRQVDRDLDQSRVNGSRREDRINDTVDRFKDAVNDLDNNGRLNDNEVRRVLDLGSQIDPTIGRARLSYNTQNLWAGIRNDLRMLGGSGYYNDDDYRNNRTNRNRYPRGGTNNGGYNLPSWWPF